MNVRYYKAQNKNRRMVQHIESEKLRLSTPKWERISQLIEYYKTLAQTDTSPIGKILLGIYNKNKEAARKGARAKNSNLLSLVSNPETLMLAYKAIKGNRGAMTTAGTVSKQDFNNMTERQQELYLKSLKLPDGMSLYHIHLISTLLRRGIYPWGTSLRIYIDKPGQPNKKRPLTIPPFTDRMVQKAIQLVLQAIYEPYWEVMNRSFGFRANKGTTDALAPILSTKASGMKTALEGDIEAAYDTVHRPTLIKILGKHICDRKFINLVINRLNYEFTEVDGKRVRPDIGIPQGGIDSPYLFNIYMNELDEFIHTKVEEQIAKWNARIPKRAFNPQYTSLAATRKKYLRWINRTKEALGSLPSDSPDVAREKNQLYKLIKEIRLTKHRQLRVRSDAPNCKILRILYVRYADDWILLTNGSKEIANALKEMVATFLKNNLGLTLSAKKTLVTDMTKEPAKFLGFELRVSGKGRLKREHSKDPASKKKFTLTRASSVLVWAQPDRVRLINRFYMKGLCDSKGMPKSIPWISTLEPQTIVERFNAAITGLVDFYLPIIRNRAKVHRWVYILRFACLKTLAQKYRCSITKIFRRYGYRLHSKGSQTVRFRVTVKDRDKRFYKDWVLLTYQDTIKRCNGPSRRKEMIKVFWDREKGVIGNYPPKAGRIPTVTNSEFLDKITWVSWRTAASFDAPCAYCGCTENVQQHHIRHIRKRAYTSIPEKESYQQILALRNRKQIPLCSNCHRKLVHTGKYDGPALNKLAPQSTKLVDNRIITLDGLVKPGKEYFAKTLIEKGWTEIVSNQLKSKKA